MHAHMYAFCTPIFFPAPSRTPALPYDQIAPRVGWERLDPLRRMEDERRHDDDDDDDDDGDDGDGDGDGMSTTDVSIWHEEYPYGTWRTLTLAWPI